MASLLQVKMNGTLQMSKRASFDALEKLKCRSFSENVALIDKQIDDSFGERIIRFLHDIRT